MVNTQRKNGIVPVINIDDYKLLKTRIKIYFNCMYFEKRLANPSSGALDLGSAHIFIAQIIAP